VCRAEYDRLIEQSPLIDDSILKQFHSIFHATDINKPEMCNGLDKCEIYQPTKEEKVAEILSNVSTKLSNKKKHMFTINTPHNDTTQHTKPLQGHSDVNDHKHELEGLATLGRVSRLKKQQQQNQQTQDKDTPHPLHRIVHDEITDMLSDTPSDLEHMESDNLMSNAPELVKTVAVIPDAANLTESDILVHKVVEGGDTPTLPSEASLKTITHIDDIETGVNDIDQDDTSDFLSGIIDEDNNDKDDKGDKDSRV
jgi:hypothetical protein